MYAHPLNSWSLWFSTLRVPQPEPKLAGVSRSARFDVGINLCQLQLELECGDANDRLGPSNDRGPRSEFRGCSCPHPSLRLVLRQYDVGKDARYLQILGCLVAEVGCCRRRR